jgi:hypothetical protein
MNLEQRCKHINALAHKHAKGEDKQEQYLIAIGRHIAAIKEEHPNDWQTIVEERCHIKRSRAYDLMAIGNGTLTLEQLRFDGAKRMRQLRDKRPSRDGQANEAEFDEQEIAGLKALARFSPKAQRFLDRLEAEYAAVLAHRPDLPKDVAEWTHEDARACADYLRELDWVSHQHGTCQPDLCLVCGDDDED